MDNTFGKDFKLKKQKLIDDLFLKGKWFSKFPIKVVLLNYNLAENEPFKCGFSVSKKNFKHAVDRNRIKRLMREVVRLNKDLIKEKINKPSIFMIIYSSNQMPDFKIIEEKILKILVLL